MKLRNIYGSIFLTILIYGLPACQGPLPELGRARLLEYTLALDARDWLWNMAANPNDSLFQIALLEMGSVRSDSVSHPLDPFIAVMMFHQGAGHLARWFPSIIDSVTSDLDAYARLEQAYAAATRKLHKTLEKRFATSHVEVKEIRIMDDAYIRLQVYGEERPIEQQLLLPRGKLGFYETYAYKDVIGRMQELRDSTLLVDSLGLGYDFFRLIYPFDTTNYLETRQLPHFYGDVPIVGYVADSDVTRLDSFWRNPLLPAVLPSNLALCYSREEVEEWPGVYPLIALKTSSEGGPRLDGSCVVSAWVDYEPATTNPMVSIKMNPEGAAEWRRMTRFNKGKSVAIVCDGIVWTYPTILAEIAGGRSQITGYFTMEEAQNLAQVIASGAYPANIVIVAKKAL